MDKICSNQQGYHITLPSYIVKKVVGMCLKNSLSAKTKCSAVFPILGQHQPRKMIINTQLCKYNNPYIGLGWGVESHNFSFKIEH